MADQAEIDAIIDEFIQYYAPPAFANMNLNRILHLINQNAGSGGGGSGGAIGINTGSSIQSGSAGVFTFSIAHGLGLTPTYFAVTPASSDAQGIAWVTADGLNITVHYNAAPPVGTNNLSFRWIVK